MGAKTLFKLSLKKTLSGFEDFSSKSLGIALSGGMDSVVLLHWAVQEAVQWHCTVKAYHVHHGLNKHADQWVEFCRQYCQRLNVDMAVHYLTPEGDFGRQAGQSVEAWARESRYQWLAQQPVEAVLLGHHQSDQAETLLLQLFRGAGLAGLSAMPTIACHRGMHWVRPFLELPREALKQYAEYYGLQWIEDSSNQDEQWERNWLRHTVMPILKARQPSIEATLARSAAHCAESWASIDEDIQEHLATIKTRKDRLNLSRWLTLSPFRQKQTLRAFFKEWTGYYPSTKLLEQALALFRMPYEAERHRSHIQYQGVRFSLWQDEVWAHVVPPAKELLQGESCVRLGDTYPTYRLAFPQGVLVFEWDEAVLLEEVASQTLFVKFRQGGERMVLRAGRPSVRLKDHWYQAKIVPWHREVFPLLVSQSADIVWAPTHLESEESHCYIGQGSLIQDFPSLKIRWEM